MQSYRCRCGLTRAWTSMGVPACSGCPYCESDLAQGPMTHGEVRPHNLVTRYNPSTGSSYQACRDCMRTEASIAEGKKRAAARLASGEVTFDENGEGAVHDG